MTRMIIKIAALLTSVYACGQSGWLKGLYPKPVPDTRVTISISDYDSATGWLWLGGKSESATDFGLPAIVNSKSAILLYVHDNDLQIDQGYLIDSVTLLTVADVRALRTLDGIAFGVLDALDKMVLFKAQPGGTELSLQMIDGFILGSYAKIDVTRHFFSPIGNPSADQPIALTFKHQNEQNAYFGLWKPWLNTASMHQISFIDSLEIIGLDTDAVTGRSLWGGHGIYSG